MGPTKAGYEATLLFIGTAGSTATNQLTNVTDVEYNRAPERGATTTKGDGSAPPVGHSRVLSLTPTITFTMLNKPNDTHLATLLAAAAVGAPVAMRTRHHVSGLGFDGDVNLEVREGGPLSGVGTFEFTAEADDSAGRTAQLWV